MDFDNLDIQNILQNTDHSSYYDLVGFSFAMFLIVSLVLLASIDALGKRFKWTKSNTYQSIILGLLFSGWLTAIPLIGNIEEKLSYQNINTLDKILIKKYPAENLYLDDLRDSIKEALKDDKITKYEWYIIKTKYNSVIDYATTGIKIVNDRNELLRRYKGQK